jgi:hypothetical protein
MSKVTDEMQKDIERDWQEPRYSVKVLEYITRPEFKITICFYRVDYVGTDYSVVRVKLRFDEGGGYDNQVVSSGDIMQTV